MTHRILLSLCVLVPSLWTMAEARGADPAQIQEAVERGVVHLKKLQVRNGSWPRGDYPGATAGATALAGLALLECNVPPNDPAIQGAAAYLRNVWTSIDDYATYATSLVILFLDRLGESADEPIIQALGVRLLAGQNAEGGWEYSCPPLLALDLQTLQKVLKRQADSNAGERPKPAASRSKGTTPALPNDIAELVAIMRKRPMPPADNPGGDNSNTQFAVLALWVARRHGIPVELALARTAARFRSGQNSDGGWGYLYRANTSVSKPSMTCAGLTALALGLGGSREAVLRAETDPRGPKAGAKKPVLVPAKDPAMRAGFAFLSRAIGQPMHIIGPASTVALWTRTPSGEKPPPSDLFFLLWSIERVAVTYDQATIGKKDWYDWGAKLLLSTQQADGGWNSALLDNVDTSFALLFLRRANLARDLTPYLKSGEPVQTVLKGGVNEAAKPQPDLGASDGETPIPPAKTAKAPAPKPAPVAENKKPKPDSGKNEKPAPPAAESAEVERLRDAVLKASGAQQTQLIDQLKLGKGADYTTALAAAVDRLTGAAKSKARDALAERLARMTPATLRDKLQDEDTEIRRAGALACAMKEDKQFLPDLIALLNDKQTSVVRAAHAALKALSGQDFGPPINPSPGAVRRSITDWENWLKSQTSK